MLPTTIRSPPSLDEYKTLAEHQEQTPQTFFGGKPVLHYYATDAKAWIPKSQLGSLPFFPADLTAPPTAPEGSALDGAAEECVEQKVDLYVNSQSFIIFCPAAGSGLTIPYPLISIHAIKTIGAGEQKYTSVYLQLELPDGSAEADDTLDTVELTLIPPPSLTPDAAEGQPTVSETTKLFNAVSDCSNLNPDPVEDGDEDDEDDYDRIVFEGDHEEIEGLPGVYLGEGGNGDLPPPMPGSSGWITAENVHEYFDADGNWIGGEEEGEELGEGAGAVHAREEEEGVNGHSAGKESDSKRPRTD
ncbi:regulator of volume decrease after cellular swelling-domain-containing protein [Diplogelasinospora grovesii]|uniref:Regulator of volume decrease after cellular swelling-domain-containing protein n=1 Tax=Diplogelasinospora grovesii TaxID=303347 RepID=A0AAN6NHA2_9PEZI|nr:regulator of volume decrease after cellular swelling-domain-containing protein [Diplogelasinospora grovesii]